MNQSNSTRHHYRNAIILVITVKLLALSLIWLFCFSHPLSRELTPEMLTSQLMNSER